MKHTLYVIAGILAFSMPLAAQDAPAETWAGDAATGDAAMGETLFSRQCVACHMIADETGELIAGSRAGIGPNLYGITGAAPGSREDYDGYGDDLIAYGETGAIWEEQNMVAFVQDPNGHLRDALGEPRARSKMSFRLRSEDDARNIYAYLATFSVAEDEAAATDLEDDSVVEAE